MTVLDTPATRVRNRKNPAVPLPPRPPQGSRRSALNSLQIVVDGVPIDVAGSVEDDPTISATYDGTETVTIQVRDPDQILQGYLGDEALLLNEGVTVTINGIVYILQDVNVDDQTGTLVTLAFEDQVSWRLKQFTRYVTFPRSKYTRAQAVQKLVQEASRPPLEQMGFFIPELNDQQTILQSAVQSVSVAQGTGANTGAYTVKGDRATAVQRAVIDGVLGEAQAEGASRRVMVACIMCVTQESDDNPDAGDGDHIGPFQQSPTWGSVAQRTSPAGSTRAFLAKWKTVQGAVNICPGDIAGAIDAVQVSGLPALYAQWETEATATVNTWLGAGGQSTSTSVTVIEPYDFTRGSKTDGTTENSWDATARWASQVNFRRWAQQNVLFYVSDDELRSAAPALEVWGDEDWLLAPPGYTWNPDQPVSEIQMRVLADRWSIRIGAAVQVQFGPCAGILLVSGTDGNMVSPELTVTLRRPSTKRAEPAADTSQQTLTSVDTSSSLLAACKTISDQNRPYVWGGGHNKPLSQIGPTEGLDCSGSVSLALWMAGMWAGDEAMVAEEIATSYGDPGVTSTYAVRACSTHTWIEFFNAPYARFDTSPHGDGPLGPHLRTQARTDIDRFVPRHWGGKT